MRLPPNRLFYFLPLLFFGWPTPSLSAQTWTTVWTPGSAPATKAGTGSTNRNYNTNCYPCMMWDTYANNQKGGWEPMPFGTDPIRCKGDTNDYTCKVCDDGLGGITNATDYISCGTCGCCEGGICVEYTNNCPNPPPMPTVSFVKAGPCGCTDPNAVGCTAPAIYPVPMPHLTACRQNCKWIPVVNSFVLEYFEGLCPNNCQNTIQSANDVNGGNYCAIKDAIQDRINNISPNAPPPTGAPGPEEFCFEECLQAHEDIHVGQLSQEWEFFGNLILDDISQISVPFDCETARTESQALAEMLHDVALIMLTHYPSFRNAWEIPGRGEGDAYQAEQDCLSNLASQIQQMATANCWTCP